MSEQTLPVSDTIRRRVDAYTGPDHYRFTIDGIEYDAHWAHDTRRLLDENARLNAENERLERRLAMEKMHRESSVRQRQDLQRKLIGWREAAEKARAELDRVIREAAADKARLAAKLADLEAQIEAGRRVEKSEPCPECGGTVSPWRDVWGKVGFHACTTCTWPLPGPDGAPRTAPEMPRPPAKDCGCTDLTVCDAHADEWYRRQEEAWRGTSQERAGDADTSGTGSGRGTGVAEAPGTARASDG